MGLFSWFKSNATPQTKEEVVAPDNKARTKSLQLMRHLRILFAQKINIIKNYYLMRLKRLTRKLRMAKGHVCYGQIFCGEIKYPILTLWC